MHMSKVRSFTAVTKAAAKRLAKRGIHGLACSAVVGMMGGMAQAQTTLVSENWQSPLLTSGTQFTTQFSGWTFNAGAYSRTKAATADLPGVSGETASANQVVELNGDGTYGEINIAHNWAATDTYYLRVEASPMSWSGTIQRWIRPELREQDGTLLWQAPQDSTTAVPLYNSYMSSLTDYPSELTFFFQINASAFSGSGVTEGQPIRLRLDSSGQRGLYINNVTLVLGPLPADTTPPAPDPLTWDVVPAVSNFRNISMRIRSARDVGDLYGVQYFFENVTSGATSGWQNSREWAQTGLDYNTTYTYRVKARDKSSNTNESTAWSASQSATTPVQDLTPPTPDPLIWGTLPTVADYRSITMTATAATDINGVEYYFENVTKGTSSGWIAARSWTEKDLNPATLYSYRAKARDKSPDQNVSTTWSTQASAITPSEPAGTLLITRFQDPLIADNTGAPNLGNWVITGGTSVKMQTATGDGVRTDTDLANPTANQAVQFEYTTAYIEYNIPHNWSSKDIFTLTLNASPQSWSGELQRYVRPSLLEQDGTVLWAPGENMSGAERTAVPLYATLVGASYQTDPRLTFSYTIPASAFSGAGVTPGNLIRLRIASSGARGLFIDNVTLSWNKPPAGTLISFF